MVLGELVRPRWWARTSGSLMDKEAGFLLLIRPWRGSETRAHIVRGGFGSEELGVHEFVRTDLIAVLVVAIDGGCGSRYGWWGRLENGSEERCEGSSCAATVAAAVAIAAAAIAIAAAASPAAAAAVAASAAAVATVAAADAAAAAAVTAAVTAAAPLGLLDDSSTGIGDDECAYASAVRLAMLVAAYPDGFGLGCPCHIASGRRRLWRRW